MPNISVSSAWNFLHYTLLVPRIFMWLENLCILELTTSYFTTCEDIKLHLNKFLPCSFLYFKENNTTTD